MEFLLNVVFYICTILYRNYILHCANCNIYIVCAKMQKINLDLEVEVVFNFVKKLVNT